jgi:hypothetical protein
MGVNAELHSPVTLAWEELAIVSIRRLVISTDGQNSGE